MSKNIENITRILNCPPLEVGITKEQEKNILSVLTRILLNHKIKCSFVGTSKGIINTIFKFELNDYSISFSKIKKIERSIGLFLYSKQVFIQFTPYSIGFSIFVPNEHRPVLHFGTIINDKRALENTSTSKINTNIILGYDDYNELIVSDLSKMPHLMIAGMTGSGKSVCLNTIICSLLLQNPPGYIKFMMIDPKQVELSAYDNLSKSLLCPCITNPYKVYDALFDLSYMMDNRYTLMKENGCKTIDELNNKLAPNLMYPKLVLLVDELADLMIQSRKEVEPLLCRLAQLGRAAGIHIILATQRPSCDIVTGTLKVNIPARISFKVPTKTNSRIILDTQGAENLLGKGDGLLLDGSLAEPRRFQAGYISNEEIQSIINYLETNTD